jgi:hypothetical protein
MSANRATTTSGSEPPNKVAHQLVVATGFVEAGKLLLRNRAGFDARMLRFPNGEVIVRVEVAKAARTREQNAWYWAAIVEAISEHTGSTPPETHELLKIMFIPKKVAWANANGEVIFEVVIGGSTRKLDKVEFGEYCDSIRRWAALTWGLDIPDPIKPDV